MLQEDKESQKIEKSHTHTRPKKEEIYLAKTAAIRFQPLWEIGSQFKIYKIKMEDGQPKMESEAL